MLQLDAATWHRNGRDAAFLNHRDRRLAEAGVLTGVEAMPSAWGKWNSTTFRPAGRPSGRRGGGPGACRCWSAGWSCGVVAALAGWLNEAWLKERIELVRFMRPYMMAKCGPYVLTVEQERALKPEDPFRECASDCPEMIVLPAGEFMMGSPETGRYSPRAHGDDPQGFRGREVRCHLRGLGRLCRGRRVQRL